MAQAKLFCNVNLHDGVLLIPGTIKHSTNEMTKEVKSKHMLAFNTLALTD